MSISPSYIKFRLLNILTIYWTLYSLYKYDAVVGPCLARIWESVVTSTWVRHRQPLTLPPLASSCAVLATQVSKKVSLMPSSHPLSIAEITFLMLAVKAERGWPPSTSLEGSSCWLVMSATLRYWATSLNQSSGDSGHLSCTCRGKVTRLSRCVSNWQVPPLRWYSAVRLTWS